ncbi:MAG: hypothetical protein ABIH39_01315, partial [Candidatus Margulisiibacteriota bacterium]
YSGNAMYKLLKSSPGIQRIRLYGDPFQDKHSKNDDYPYWKGTVIGIDISLDIKQEFEYLLDLIRETYARTIRERRETRYKQARFI